MYSVGNQATKTLKCKSSKIEDPVPEQIKQLKEWYNRKLRDIIDLSEEIDEEDLEVEEEDWAKLITNEEFGILYQFEYSDWFSMVRKSTQEGVEPNYTVTKFGLYTEKNKEKGDQCFVIDNQLHCQCTFIERHWFKDPYTSWYIVEEKIVTDTLRKLAAKQFERDDTDEFRDHYKNYLYIKDLSTLKPEKFRLHLEALNFAPSAYNIDTTLWFE